MLYDICTTIISYILLRPFQNSSVGLLEAFGLLPASVSRACLGNQYHVITRSILKSAPLEVVIHHNLSVARNAGQVADGSS